MRCKSKGFSFLIVVILAVSSLIMVESASAQSIPKPSVPEFSIRYVDNSYYVPTATTITDQYGNSRVVQGYVENKTVEFSIKNQLFTPYTIPYNSSDPYNTDQTVNLMYNIRVKGHFEDNWQFITHLSDGYLPQSNSDDTVKSYAIEYLFPDNVPTEGRVDFQVKALIGYVHRYPIISSWTFNGTESDWSNTQTITITENSSTNPTPTPTVPELPSLTIPMLLSIMVVLTSMLLSHKKLNQRNLDKYA